MDPPTHTGCVTQVSNAAIAAAGRPKACGTQTYTPPSPVNVLPISAKINPYGTRKSTARTSAQVNVCATETGDLRQHLDRHHRRDDQEDDVEAAECLLEVLSSPFGLGRLLVGGHLDRLHRVHRASRFRVIRCVTHNTESAAVESVKHNVFGLCICKSESRCECTLARTRKRGI